MSRIVLGVFLNVDGPLELTLLSAPANYPNMSTHYPLGCDESHPAFNAMRQIAPAPDAVKEAGIALYQALTTHPAVKQAIDNMLVKHDDDVEPFYIYLESAEGELLPWETLFCPPDTFVALDKRWPIARLTGTGGLLGQVEAIERAFEPPLKVIALLAAAGVDATREWEALYDAAQHTNLDLSLHVYVCQDDLKATIEQFNDPRFTVEFLPGKPDLLRSMAEINPHILHIFCHGSLSGRAHLELATRIDHQTNQAVGSIMIELGELQQAIPLDSGVSHCWLVTLNCCQGAAPADEIGSLALSLVQARFPAAVGMREAIATDDANLFCKAFYPAIFREIERCILAGDVPTPIEWAKALHEPRAQLCDKHSAGQIRTIAAGTAKEWTLPVLYIRPGAFRLRGPATNPLLSTADKQSRQAQVAVLRATRDFMAANPGTPRGLLDELSAQIAKLEVELYAK